MAETTPGEKKRRPAKMVPKQTGISHKKAKGFGKKDGPKKGGKIGRAPHPTVPKSPAEPMRIGQPEHNPNAGSEHSLPGRGGNKGAADFKHAKGKKDARRRKRNAGRS